MPYVRLFGAQLAIGAAAIFARLALLGAGPYAISALRLGIAAIVAFAFALPLRRVSARRELAFGFAGIALAVHFATWIASLLYTSVAASTVLVATTPLWTAIYDALHKRRLPGRRFVLSLATALGGVASIVFARGSASVPVVGSAALGDLLALGGSLAIGAYFLIVRDAGARHADRLETGQIVARTYGWAAVTLAGAALVARQAPPSLGDVRAWSGVAGMALVSQLIGHTALNAALRDFAPSTVALTILLEPAIAAVLAASLLRETIPVQTIWGGALVIAAIAMTLRGEDRV